MASNLFSNKSLSPFLSSWCPAFRRWGASVASPASGRLCPLLTSPGRSKPVTRLPVLADNRKISQSKTQNVSLTATGFIKHTPLRMEDFAVTCPLVSSVPHLVSGSCSSPRAFGLDFLRTRSRDDVLAPLLAFGSANPGTGTFIPLALCHAWHNAPVQRRRVAPSAATGC